MAGYTNKSSLSVLPVELIHYILNFLDTRTILFSFGLACKRFNSIVRTFKQYRLDFQSAPKPFFDLVTRLIQPENVVSLTLSNDNQTPNQVKLFLQHFQIHQFKCLRSLKLIEIDEEDFISIAQQVIFISSFSFTFRNNSINDQQVLPLVSTILSNKYIRNLEFFLLTTTFNTLLWPNQCQLRSLILCVRISFNRLSFILSCSPQLERLVLQDCTIDYATKIETSASYPQLVSLTFDDSEMTMTECQFVLSLTPSLEHFHIIGGKNLCDGSLWEEFILTKLLKLSKFDFALNGNVDGPMQDLDDVESLILSFRTPFWIEQKHWFVICYYFKQTTSYSLYSLPICKTSVRLYPFHDKISCSTYANFDNDTSMRDRINEMQLNLSQFITNKRSNVDNTFPTYPFFSKLTRLQLFANESWPMNAVEYFSAFINFTSLTELSISVEFDCESLSSQLTNLGNFIKGTFNVHSLRIDTTSLNAESICLLVPNHIKHLHTSVKTVEDVKLIIEKLKHLSSITFELWFDINYVLEEFSAWFDEKYQWSIYRKDSMFLSIWFQFRHHSYLTAVL